MSVFFKESMCFTNFRSSHVSVNIFLLLSWVKINLAGIKIWHHQHSLQTLKDTSSLVILHSSSLISIQCLFVVFCSCSTWSFYSVYYQGSCNFLKTVLLVLKYRLILDLLYFTLLCFSQVEVLWQQYWASLMAPFFPMACAHFVSHVTFW